MLVNYGEYGTLSIYIRFKLTSLKRLVMRQIFGALVLLSSFVQAWPKNSLKKNQFFYIQCLVLLQCLPIFPPAHLPYSKAIKKECFIFYHNLPHLSTLFWTISASRHNYYFISYISFHISYNLSCHCFYKICKLNKSITVLVLVSNKDLL